MSTAVYDYNQRKVETRLVKTLQRRKREATIADLVADTGLPTYQVEETIKQIVNDYQGHMKVTESGEVLYHFPHGMRNQVHGVIPRTRRFFRKVGSWFGRALKVGFKVWTMVMLVGYFVVFVLLLLLAMVAAMAAQAKGGGGGGGGRGGMGGFGMFYLTTRLAQMFLYLWMFSGSRPDSRGRKPKGPPLHQSVFAFVFGSGNPIADWDQKERRAFLAFLRENKGIATVEDLMQLTGHDYQRAQILMNRLLVEFNGEPEATEEGTLIYRFEEVLRSADSSTDTLSGTVFNREMKPLIPFNNNKPSLNRWIGFFNGFNLVFGSYFTILTFMLPGITAEGFGAFYLLVVALFAQITATPTAAVTIVFWVMGLIPAVFSALFFTIPAVRRAREKKINERIQYENIRKRVINAVMEHPEEVDPEFIEVGEIQGLSRDQVREIVTRIVGELAAERGAEVHQKREAMGDKPAAYTYHFHDIAREKQDVERVRSSIDTSRFETGQVVFDSDQ